MSTSMNKAQRAITALRAEIRALDRAQEVLCRNTEDKRRDGDVFGKAVETEFLRLEKRRRVILARLKEALVGRPPRKGQPLTFNPFGDLKV